MLAMITYGTRSPRFGADPASRLRILEDHNQIYLEVQLRDMGASYANMEWSLRAILSGAYEQPEGKAPGTIPTGQVAFSHGPLLYLDQHSHL